MGWILTAISMVSGYTLTGVGEAAEATFWGIFKAVVAVVTLLVVVLLILWKSGILPAWLSVVGKSFDLLRNILSPGFK